MGRQVQFAAFAILMGTCIAGVAHASPWAIAVGGSLLALAGLSRGRLARTGGGALLTEHVSVVVSLLNAGCAAAGCYAVGIFARWFWGF